MAFRRLRRTLDKIAVTADHGNDSLGLVDALILELLDGVSFSLERTGDGTLMDFVTGKIDKLPLRIRLEPEEDEPADLLPSS